MAQKRKRDKDNGGRREDGAPSGAKGRKRKYVNPLDKYFSSDLETKSPEKGKSHPTSGTHSKSEHVASPPARQKPQKGKLIKSFHDSTKSSQSRVERKGKNPDSPHAFSSVDSEPVTPRNGKSHPTSEANFGRGDGPPLLAQNRAQKSTKLFRTLLYSPRSAPSSERGKGGDTNDISQSSSRDFETAPPRKRKRHPTDEADFGGEEALTPPPKKKSLNNRLAKGIRESAQGGLSRAYREVKEVNDFEESPPRHSKIGHQAKDEKRSTKKLDSKSEDVTLVTDKKKAQDARVVKSLRDSTKGGPSNTKGKSKEVKDPSEPSSRNFEITPPRKRKRHPANEADFGGEEALTPPPKKKSLNSRLAKGVPESAQGLSGAHHEVKEVSDFEESPPRHSKIGHPAKDEKRSTKKLDSKSEDVTLATDKKKAQDARVVKSLRDSTKGGPSNTKGKTKEVKDPSESSSRNFEITPPRKRKRHPTNEADFGDGDALTPPPKKKSLNSKLAKGIRESAQGGPSRAYREVKEVNDFEESPPRHPKIGHQAKDEKRSTKKLYPKSQDIELVTAKQEAQDARVVKSLRDSTKGGPGRTKGKTKEVKDPSESSSRNFEMGPPRKRKRHPTDEADFGGEETLTPPPKKKSLNSRLAKGVPESAQGGLSRAYREVKGVSDFEESPPRHSKIGHPAKDEKRSANKIDSKSEDVTLVADKKKAQDARAVKSLRGSVKGGPSRTKGKTKETRDPSESSPRDSETGAPENGEKHPTSGPYSDSEYASSSPAQQGPQNDKFIEGFCDSPKSLSGTSRNRKYPNDLSEASSSISEIGPPGKCRRLATNEANPSSDEGSLTTKAKGARGDRVIKSPHHYVQKDAVAGGCPGDAQQDNTLNLPLPEKIYGGADDPEIQSQVKTPPKPYNYFDSLVEPPRKIYLPPDRYAQHLAKLEKEKLFKEFTTGPKAWEKRKLHQRGPRAGRSDEFNTQEEAQYAENIMREATRRRLETWHRERHEMWGLKKVQLPEKTYQDIEASEQEDSEEESEVEGSEVEEEDPEPKTQVAQEDQKDDATVQDILQGIPKPLDPCFNSPANIVFLPRTAKFNEVVFQLEYHQGYTRKQVLWLMGGAREGRDPVPSANTLGMRLLRYMKKNKLTDTVKVAPVGTVAKPTLKAYHGDDKGSGDDAEQERPLLPHGPRIRSRELGVHSWFWDHPHEILQKKIYGRTYTTLE